MNEKNLENKLIGLLPELFVDVIARIVPGFIVFALSINLLKELISGISGFFVSLVISYALGLILDIFGNLLVQIRCFGYLIGHWHKYSDKIIWSKIWENTKEQNTKEHRALLVKLMSEKTFFRSLILISIFFISFPQERVLNTELPPYFFYVSLIIFILCNFRMHIITIETLKSIEKSRGNLLKP